jgi:4-amino-4-deoxy-L-arabinose transferase-like glycosyltransferase
LLAGALVLLTHAAVRHTVDRGTAHFTVLLMAVSPWLWFMSGEFMPHPLAATCTIASLLAAVRLRGGAGPRWVLVAGFSLGLLATVRPLDAALAALLVCACLVAPGAPRRLVALVASGVLAMAIAAVVLPYNHALTGRATYTPQMLWTDRRWGPGTDRLGFGGDIGIREWSNIDPLPGHGVADVLVNLNRNLAITQAELLGWCVGSLLLFVVGLALRPPRGNTAPWRSLVGLFVGGYCLYWFSGGPDLGARYWYPALPGFAVLSVLGATALCRVWQHPRSGAAVLRSAIVLTLAALVSVVPARAVTKFHGYRLIGSDVAALVRSEGIRNSVVFLRTPQRSRYQAAFHLNSVPLGDDNVFARDAGAASRAAVLRAFPGRTVWVLEADSLSGVLRVAARPDA